MEKSVPGTPNIRSQENSSIRRGSKTIPAMPAIRSPADMMGKARIEEQVRHDPVRC
jgi:rRNA maturation protein Nop10